MLTAHGVKYPYIKKYCHTHAVSGITNDNWPVYRYAETLLFIAEALNEQGKTDEALTYLNQVRKRAGLNDCEVTNQGLLREAILNERRVELAFDSFRQGRICHEGLWQSGKGQSTGLLFPRRLWCSSTVLYRYQNFIPVTCSRSRFDYIFLIHIRRGH